MGATQVQPSLAQRVVSFFVGRDPTFRVALVPALLVGLVLFVRSPLSNCIFDEQEALLANPYVNGAELGLLDAFVRDFWGLPPDRTIGSYRPLPNLLWRLCWAIGETPFLPHLLNVVIHGLNAALLAAWVLSVGRGRALAWMSGAIYLCCAVLTEAVTGVVGTADVLAGLGAMLALHALRLPLWLMPLGSFGAVLLGLFSKESGIVAVGLLGWTALLTARPLHPERPLAPVRALVAGLSGVAGLVLYTELRKKWFPITLPEQLRAPLPDSEPMARQLMHEFLRWFAQPRLPQDPINNPLVDAGTAERVAGALSVYAKGLGQVLFPWTLSGDYSAPQEPIPTSLVSFPSAIGFLALGLPILLAVWFGVRSVFKKGPLAHDALWGMALLWCPLAYLPHSNLMVLLPTVRAERFWYLPAIGTAIVLALAWSRLKAKHQLYAALVACFFLGFQALQARTHALHYSHDLAFWRAAAVASSNSAKAHLNYSVMLGSRSRLEERLVRGDRAIALAPRWPMAHVYRGDTLCRLRQGRRWTGPELAEIAWPSYKRGFELNPNDSNLIALGLQCLYTEQAFESLKHRLQTLAHQHPGSWLEYLVEDVVRHGKENGGVAPKYRPRGYNEGPKAKAKATASSS